MLETHRNTMVACVTEYVNSDFETQLLAAPDGNAEALVTGYFEPFLPGQRTADDNYRFPLYNVPSDLTKGVPDKTRQQIDSGEVSIPATVIAYLKNDMDRY